MKTELIDDAWQTSNSFVAPKWPPCYDFMAYLWAVLRLYKYYENEVKVMKVRYKVMAELLSFSQHLKKYVKLVHYVYIHAAYGEKQSWQEAVLKLAGDIAPSPDGTACQRQRQPIHRYNADLTIPVNL